LHRKENDAWYFSKNENLKKKIEKYAATAAQPKIDAEMERRLKLIFEPKRRNAYTEVLALPKIEDIKPSGGRVLQPSSTGTLSELFCWPKGYTSLTSPR